MKLDKRLNLIIPVERGDATVYVHSMPIGRECFETYFLPLSKTFAAIYSEGLGILGGPRIAALMLKRVSTELGIWDGDAGVARGLMAEIRRLTNVVAPGANGWETFPFQDAVSRQYFDADDIAEIENALVFNSAAWAMHRKAEAAEVMAGAARLWGAQTSPLNCTGYTASLPTLTETAPSTPKVASSVPS